MIKEKELTKDTLNLKKIRRKNVKLYPVYKMFAWDLLCFYPIEFLFYTITKQVTASQILIITAFYIIFKILLQIPAVTISDFLGKRNSIILGNILVCIYLLILIFAPGMIGIIIANFICALGYDIKALSETNLLYDSVATKGGEGLYTKIDSKGASCYYYLNGICGLATGYLFVFNNYLPIITCLIFAMISTILSFGFKEIYPKEHTKTKSFKNTFKEYKSDLKQSMKFILHSNRLKSYIMFGAIFYGIIEVIDTYKSELLVVKGIPEEQYSIILAALSLIAGISASFSKKIHQKFRNKTLTFISLSYIGSCLLISIISLKFTNNIAIPIILILYTVLRTCDSIWYIIEYKYLNNFTKEESRNKIIFAYEFIGGIVASTMSVIGSIVLDIFEINNAFILVSLVFLIMIVLILDYMRTRFGLKLNQYKKEDIEF